MDDKSDIAHSPAVTSMCWLWQDPNHPTGYSYVVVDGKRWRAHRYSYFLAHGEIPNGAMICHKCDNKACIRPDHLYAGTARSNWLDGVTHGGNPFKVGQKNLNGKLTDAEILKIRSLRGVMVQEKIAEKFGVSRSHVANIVVGRKRCATP